MKTAYHTFPVDWKALLSEGLSDDQWQWDWTSLGTLVHPRRKGRNGHELRARIVAKSEGVWAAQGLNAAVESLSSELGGAIKTRSRLTDGARIRPGTVVAEWQGPVRHVLAFERPYLNLASYVSGIATQTRRLVDAVEQTCPERAPRVAATRKILPHYRDVAIYGVLAGGGHSHRVNLAGGVLIKENHIAAAGGIDRAVHGAISIAPHGLKIEVEVRNLNELKAAVTSGADGALLDNFTPTEVARALGIMASFPEFLIEVSGGINEANVSEYALPGVHVISSGSLTHSVRAIDLSLLVGS